MAGTTKERLDLLTAEGLALSIALGSLLRQLPEELRKAAYGESRELLDALSAYPNATHSGHRVFEQAGVVLGQIFHEPPAPGEAPQRDG